eukprot:3338620-Prymnesium_polylepis.1
MSSTKSCSPAVHRSRSRGSNGRRTPVPAAESRAPRGRVEETWLRLDGAIYRAAHRVPDRRFTQA